MTHEQKTKAVEYIIDKLKHDLKRDVETGYVCNYYFQHKYKLCDIDFDEEQEMIREFPELYDYIMEVGEEYYIKAGQEARFEFGDAWLVNYFLNGSEHTHRNRNKIKIELMNEFRQRHNI